MRKTDLEKLAVVLSCKYMIFALLFTGLNTTVPTVVLLLLLHSTLEEERGFVLDATHG